MFSFKSFSLLALSKIKRQGLVRLLTFVTKSCSCCACVSFVNFKPKVDARESKALAIPFSTNKNAKCEYSFPYSAQYFEAKVVFPIPPCPLTSIKKLSPSKRRLCTFFKSLSLPKKTGAWKGGEVSKRLISCFPLS